MKTNKEIASKKIAMVMMALSLGFVSLGAPGDSLDQKIRDARSSTSSQSSSTSTISGSVSERTDNQLNQEVLQQLQLQKLQDIEKELLSLDMENEWTRLGQDLRHALQDPQQRIPQEMLEILLSELCGGIEERLQELAELPEKMLREQQHDIPGRVLEGVLGVIETARRQNRGYIEIRQIIQTLSKRAW